MVTKVACQSRDLPTATCISLLISPHPPDEALSAERSAGGVPIMSQAHSWLVMLSAAQSPAAPVDPLQQAYAGMQHYTGEAL